MREEDLGGPSRGPALRRALHRLQVPRGAPTLTDAPGGAKGPFLVAAAIIAVDQLTKIWAVASLSDGPVRVMGDTLMFRLTRNPGGAFSLLTGFTPLLALLAAAMVVVIIRTARRTEDPLVAYGLGMVLGGAVGNLIDRVVRDPGFLSGHVVDFVKVSFFDFPTFNVADSGITIGVALIILRSTRA